MLKYRIELSREIDEERLDRLIALIQQWQEEGLCVKAVAFDESVVVKAYSRQ